MNSGIMSSTTIICKDEWRGEKAQVILTFRDPTGKNANVKLPQACLKFDSSLLSPLGSWVAAAAPLRGPRGPTDRKSRSMFSSSVFEAALASRPPEDTVSLHCVTVRGALALQYTTTCIVNIARNKQNKQI